VGLAFVPREQRGEKRNGWGGGGEKFVDFSASKGTRAENQAHGILPGKREGEVMLSRSGKGEKKTLGLKRTRLMTGGFPGGIKGKDGGGQARLGNVR